MQIERDPRMNPHQAHAEWMDQAPSPVPYAPPAPTTSAPSAPALPAIAQRRRSSAAHIRPAAPPPNLPIPSLPSSTISLAPSSTPDWHDITSHSGKQQTDVRGTRSSSFNRPTVSGNLTAVANFSQVRQTASAPSSQSPLQAAAADTDELPDLSSSGFPTSSTRMPEQHHDHGRSQRLSPPSTEQRPSSRRALTRALELAREAVQLDLTNEDPEAAVNAYARSVALLSEVMEKVRRGEDSTESRRGRRRRSVAAQEEEVRRLQNIHDTYADRMNILSIIYSIPPVPYSGSSLYPPSHSVSSTNTNTPTHSVQPSTENSPQIPHATFGGTHSQEDVQYNGVEYPPDDVNDTLQPVGSSITLDESVLINNNLVSGLPSSTSQHPYANTPHHHLPQPPPPTVPAPTPRISPLKRPRASSQLPPAQPPPTNSLPPAPAATAEFHSDATYVHSTSRPETKYQPDQVPRGLSSLGTLEEEDTGIPPEGADVITDFPQNTKRDSHPLPPIPSPASSADTTDTPRTSIHVSKGPASPRHGNHAHSRSRGPSIVARQEPQHSTVAQSVPIINSTTHGTIHQRRTKTSLPSRPGSPDSNISTGSVPKPAPPLLPAQPTNSQIGRARSSSQPGRRPSIINAALEQRPPVPPSAGSNGISGRKPSFPSKLIPLPPLGAVPQNETMSPSVGTPMLPSSTPAPMSVGIVSFVPASPPLPTPPSDPLRQPYFMMNVLAASMMSPTGGYITRRLHVPSEVWTISGVKLSNVAEKIRVLEILLGALEDLQMTSSEYFGAGNVSSGMAMGIGSIGGKEANAWLAKLEDFSNICDGIVANFGKKLGVGESFALKKTTWSDKLSRQFDKLTNGKNGVDSPTAYMHHLRKLLQNSQLLDEHTKAVWAQPVAPAYSAFPSDTKASTEQKLKRASEFFTSVVLTFVIRDLALLLDKYVKRSEKVLEE